MFSKPKESDWKQFRSITDTLRERYLKEKNLRLSQMLSAPNKTATEQFWDTLEAMNKEAKILQDCLDGHSRSNMFMSMRLMWHYGMLKPDDLKLFSETLQQQLTEQ